MGTSLPAKQKRRKTSSSKKLTICSAQGQLCFIRLIIVIGQPATCCSDRLSIRRHRVSVRGEHDEVIARCWHMISPARQKFIHLRADAVFKTGHQNFFIFLLGTHVLGILICLAEKVFFPTYERTATKGPKERESEKGEREL